MAESAEHQAVMGELKNIHHRVNEVHDLASKTNGRVDALELDNAFNKGATEAHKSMRSESYKVVGAVLTIATIAVAFLEYNGPTP